MSEKESEVEFTTLGKEFDVKANESVSFRIRKTKIHNKNTNKDYVGIQIFRLQNGSLQKGKSIWIHDDAAVDVALHIIRKQKGPKTFKKVKAMLGKGSK
tara:strand:- start:18015 stop:18311 length:297 start_codon:yes stop_codon:yes gene_type:complete